MGYAGHFPSSLPARSPAPAHRGLLEVQVLVTVMHLTRWHINSNQASVLIAFQVLLLWLKVQYFARCGCHCPACNCHASLGQRCNESTLSQRACLQHTVKA